MITFIPLTGYLPGEVPVISPSTGLLGVPEETQNGIEFQTLLNQKSRWANWSGCNAAGVFAVGT